MLKGERRAQLYRMLYRLVRSGTLNVTAASETVFSEFGIPWKDDWLSSLKPYIPEVEYQFLLLAQHSGKLEEGLRAIADQVKRTEKTKARFFVSILPVIIEIVVGLGIFLFIVGFVVPKMKSLLSSFGGELPAVSRAVFGVGEFMFENWWWLLGLVFLGGWVLARNWKETLYTIPLFRRLALIYEKILFFDSLSFLQSAGINVANAVTLLDFRFINVRRIADLLTQGKTFRDALEGVADPIEEKLIETGEISGELSETFPEIAEINREKLFLTLEKLSRSITYVLIAVLGVLVFFVVLAVYLPLVSAITRVG